MSRGWSSVIDTDRDRQELFSLLLQEEGLAVPSRRSIPRNRPAESARLSFAQQRLWFLWRLAPNSPFYNVPLVLQVSGDLQVPAFSDALRRVLERHEALRTVFVLQ